MALEIKITGADTIAKNFQKAPEIAKKWYGKALKAATFEVLKYAVKGIVPWDKGLLTNTFRTKIGADHAFIFPTRTYAPYVYFGTSRGIRPNPFLDRMAELATDDVVRHFSDASEQIAKELTK